MAHQAHNIPWNLVAKNFSYRVKNRPRRRGSNWHVQNGLGNSCYTASVTDLHPRFKASQGKDLEYFVSAFASTLGEHIGIELRKLDPPRELAEPDDVVLSNEVVQKISPTIHRVRLTYDTRRFPEMVERTYTPGKLCRSCSTSARGKCKCPLTRADRQMRAFLHPWIRNACYQFERENRDMWLGFDTLKCLILYGEMKTLLRICAHPDVDISSWEEMYECYDVSPTLGWDSIYQIALRSYVCLNVLYCYPELWNEDAGKTDKQDYRLTAVYQRAIHSATYRDRLNDVVRFPHRQFFGISNTSWRAQVTYRHRDGDVTSSTEQDRSFGILPIDGLLRMLQGLDHKPSQKDVSDMQSILMAKGLPIELALTILDFASYAPSDQRLIRSHDPLHPVNSRQLREYLTYCWTLLVRCGVLANSQGGTIDWKIHLRRCIIDLWPEGGKLHSCDPEEIWDENLWRFT